IYGPAGGDVTAAEYRARLAEAVACLDGEVRAMVERLRNEMAAAAEAREFERAARLRDLIFAVERTIEPVRRQVRPKLRDGTSPATALTELAAALGLAQPPTVIEGFDISHISGTFCVASLVRFVGGKPDTAGYRRL